MPMPYSRKMVLALLLSCASHVSSAAGRFPVLLAQVSLPDVPVAVRTTLDHHYALVIIGSKGPAAPQNAMVLDLTTVTAPIVKSIFPLQGSTTRFELAPDGSRAVFLVTRRTTSPATSVSEIVAFDLRDPAKPIPQWRRAIPVGNDLIDRQQIAIAADAGAYAISGPAPDGGAGSEILIQKIGDDRQPAIGMQSSSFDPTLGLSASGRYLAVGTQPFVMNSVGIFDLSSSPPASQTQAYSLLPRYQCIVAVLNDGHLLLDDARTKTLGVYAPSPGVPRVASLNFQPDCSAKTSYDDKGHSLVFATSSSVERLDLRDPQVPRVSGHWLIPLGMYALTVSGDLLFGASSSANLKPTTLLIYRLSDQASGPGDFDWGRLKAAHRRIMAEYYASKEFVVGRRVKALFALRKAGAAQAAELPVIGISPKQAAEILDDYGYLATQLKSDLPTAEAALRRAILLDAGRRVAYLNLADLLRTQLPAIPSDADREATGRDAASLYEAYFARGGKRTAEIDLFLRAVEAQKEPMPICKAIATYADEGGLQGVISDQALGIAVAHRRVDIFFDFEGSAHVPSYYAFDADTDEPLDLRINAPWEGALWGGDELGLLVYQRAPYILHYRDAKHPVHSVPLDAGPACDFRTGTAERAARDALEPQLCAEILDGTAPKGIAFTQPANISEEQIAQRYSETSGGNTALIDFENDGHPKRVIDLSLSSGAGAGCDEEFFDVLSASGKRFGSDGDHTLIAALQHMISNRYPILPCENAPRFINYRGKVYFESTPASKPTDLWNEYHYVTRIENGQARDVCNIQFETSTTYHEHAVAQHAAIAVEKQRSK